MAQNSSSHPLAAIVEALRSSTRVIVVSHSRPDGDAVGSSLAMAFALRAIGKSVRVVSRDAPPPPMLVFPGVSDIEVTDHVNAADTTVIVMECGDLARTGVDGLASGRVINIDHHPGNTEYGALNWVDLSAAACGEMVFDLVGALGVSLTREIATHVYMAVLTDTGSFHYSHVSPRTFEICRQCTEAGVDPPAVARAIFDNNDLARLRLFGAVLNRMLVSPDGRVATLSVDQQLARDCGGTYEDTEGLINLPLTVKDILAVVFFKEIGPDDWRVSMRSKGAINVNAIAKRFGGGGHVNASGCGASGDLATLSRTFSDLLTESIDVANPAAAGVGNH